MKKVLSVVALMAFMVSSASVVDFKEKKKTTKTEKSCCSDKKAADKNHALLQRKNLVVQKIIRFKISTKPFK